MAKIFENIDKISVARGITMTELSRKAKVPISTLNELRKGQKQNVSLNVAARIAKALDCTLDALVSKDDADEAENKLLEMILTSVQSVQSQFCAESSEIISALSKAIDFFNTIDER